MIINLTVRQQKMLYTCLLDMQHSLAKVKNNLVREQMYQENKVLRNLIRDFSCITLSDSKETEGDIDTIREERDEV